MPTNSSPRAELACPRACPRLEARATPASRNSTCKHATVDMRGPSFDGSGLGSSDQVKTCQCREALLSSNCDGVTNLGTSRPSNLEGGASRQYRTLQQREMRMKATALRFALAAVARCSSTEPPSRKTPPRLE